MACDKYIEAVICPGQPSDPPHIYVCVKQLIARAVGSEIVYRYMDKDGTKWCFKAGVLPAETWPQVDGCALPSDAVIVNINGRETFANCGDCDSDFPVPNSGNTPIGAGAGTGIGIGPGGTGGPCPDGSHTWPCPGGSGGGGGPENLTKYYPGTPCADSPSGAPTVWGTPWNPTDTGTFVERYGAWCYTFNVDGSGTTPPAGTDTVWLRFKQSCDDCTKAIPIQYCDNQGFNTTTPLLFVKAAGAPTTEMWFEFNGICCHYDPTLEPMIVPRGGLLISPSNQFPDCATCTDGILATLCPDQPKANTAPKLWIRADKLPATLVVDIYAGFRYIIDPSADHVPRPGDAVNWTPQGNFSNCTNAKCGIAGQGIGVQWFPCPNQQAYRAHRIWTKAADLPAAQVIRRINGFCYSLDPYGTHQTIPAGDAVVDPTSEFFDCYSCFSESGGGGGDPGNPTDPGDGSGGGGGSGPGDGGGGDGPGDGGGGGTGNGGGGGDDGHGPTTPPVLPPGTIIPPCPTPPCGPIIDPNPCDYVPPPCPPPPPDDVNDFCKKHPRSCASNLFLCNCTSSVYTDCLLNQRIPNIPLGSIVRIAGNCYTKVGDPWGIIWPSTDGQLFATCDLCATNRCFYQWNYDCTTDTISSSPGVTCQPEEAVAGPFDTWVWDDIAHAHWIHKGGACVGTGSCTTPPPTPAKPPRDATGLSCPKMVRVHFDSTGGTGTGGCEMDGDYDFQLVCGVYQLVAHPPISCVECGSVGSCTPPDGITFSPAFSATLSLGPGASGYYAQFAWALSCVISNVDGPYAYGSMTYTFNAGSGTENTCPSAGTYTSPSWSFSGIGGCGATDSATITVTILEP